MRERTWRLPAWPRSVVWSLSPRWAVGFGVGSTVAGSALLAIVLVRFGPTPALGVLIGLGALLILVSDPRAGIWVNLLVLSLLPYAVIPVRVVITPPVLEVIGLATIALWLVSLFSRRDEVFEAHPLLLAVLSFIAVTVFSFVLGMGRGYTTLTYHNYAKFLVSTALFFVAWGTWRSVADIQRFTAVLWTGTTLAALLGLALYAGGPQLTLMALSRLIPYGYPTSRIVRFIEDDPAKPMRLTSTSVDPNSFAGLLAVVCVLAVVQLVARYPVFPRWVSGIVALCCGAALVLTYSRAGWVGTAVGLGFVALVRYRRLIIPGVLGVLAGMMLGFGGRIFERLWLGLTLQDRATQMRLEEYRTALAIIREYPAFGVGFGQAPTIELWTGVSSIYLLVAEQMGLLGLLALLVVLVSTAGMGWRTWRAGGWITRSDLLLSWLSALLAVLVIGLFDHYYLNASFPHMVALFWFVIAAVGKLSVLSASCRVGER